MIVGYGSIGAAVERRLDAFGVRFLRVARSARPGVQSASALPELVGVADIVVVLLPLTAATVGLIDARLLEAMKPEALLVNAGRGGVIDQGALIDALFAGRLRAALDVSEPEPLPQGSRLWSAPNLLLTPHIAGDTPRRYRRSWQLVADQVQCLLDERQLQNVVAAAHRAGLRSRAHQS